MLPLIRVVLVDDHSVVLEAFAALLDLDLRFEIVGTATTAEEGVALTCDLQPDIAVFDIDFDGLDAFDVIPKSCCEESATKLVFLTAHYSDIFLHQALAANARGYLLKNEAAVAVRDSLVRVHRGDFAFSRAASERLVFDEASGSYSIASKSMLFDLSPAQLSILRHLARGLTVKEIAAVLGKSEKSIDSHKYRIMHKLDIHDRVELCRYAIRKGLTMV